MNKNKHPQQDKGLEAELNDMYSLAMELPLPRHPYYYTNRHTGEKITLLPEDKDSYAPGSVVIDLPKSSKGYQASLTIDRLGSNEDAAPQVTVSVDAGFGTETYYDSAEGYLVGPKRREFLAGRLATAKALLGEIEESARDKAA